MKKLNKKGFTIVELVIVIAVIAILAAVLIPTFATVIDKANQSAALQTAKNYYTEDLAACDGVYNNTTATQTHGTFTFTVQGAVATYTVTATINGYTCVYTAANTNPWDVHK